MDVVWLLASFAVILSGALLFTNAIEWSGHRLGLGEGATGSLLAAVGTAMPETLIPIVAIIGGGAGADDVAVGAIIGAPFLLATIAMALIGISALAFSSRRAQGIRLEADVRTLDRDLLFFLAFFSAAIVIGAGLRARGRLRGRLRRLCARDPAWRRRRAGGRDDRAALHGPRRG
jgi:cation:H+ antiporter